MPFIHTLFPSSSSVDFTEEGALALWWNMEPTDQAGGSVTWQSSSGGFNHPIDYDPNSTGIEFNYQNSINFHHGVGGGNFFWPTYSAAGATTFEAQSSVTEYNTEAKIGAAFVPANTTIGGTIRWQPNNANAPQDEILVAIGDVTTDGYYIRRRSTGGSDPDKIEMVIINGGGAESIIHSTAITDNLEHLLAWYFDEDNLRLGLSIDGGAYETAVVSDGPNQATQTIHLASSHQAGAQVGGMTGTMCHLGLYVGGYLSEEKLSALWAAGYGTLVESGVPVNVDYDPLAETDYAIYKSSANQYATAASDQAHNRLVMGGIVLRRGSDIKAGAAQSVLCGGTGATIGDLNLYYDSQLTMTIRDSAVIRSLILGPDPFGGTQPQKGDYWCAFLIRVENGVAGEAGMFGYFTGPKFLGWRYSGNVNSPDQTYRWLPSAANGGGIGGRSGAGSWIALRHFFVTTADLDISSASVRNAIFYDTGYAKALNTTSWAQLGGTQPLIYAPDGDVVNNNLGSLSLSSAGTNPTVVSPSVPYPPLTWV